MKKKLVITIIAILFMGIVGVLIKNSLEPQPKTMKDYNETQLFSLAQQIAKREGCLEALPYFDEVLKRDPKHFSAYEQKGDCLIKLKRYPEALAAIESAAVQSPERYQNKINFIKNKMNQPTKEE